MEILLKNFYELFMEQPDSEEALFAAVQKDMALIDPDWLQSCKPAPKEDIEHLENALLERFGRGIPSSYRIYLERMGEEDGGLVSRRVDDLGFWNYFRGDNMAQGAVRHMEELDEYRVQFERNAQKPFPIPPFWNYYYTSYAGWGCGFSPKTKCLDQIVQTDGVDDYFLTHDTFSKFLFYCTYETITNQIWMNSTEFDGPLYSLPEDQRTHCVWMSVECPLEWSIPDPTLMVAFLEEIEAACSLEECWFSSQKELHLFDDDDVTTEEPYEFARYVACQSFSNVTVSMRFEPDCEETEIQIWIVSQDSGCTKWLVNEILKRTTLIDGAFTIKCMD